MYKRNFCFWAKGGVVVRGLREELLEMHVPPGPGCDTTSKEKSIFLPLCVIQSLSEEKCTMDPILIPSWSSRIYLSQLQRRNLCIKRERRGGLRWGRVVWSFKEPQVARKLPELGMIAQNDQLRQIEKLKPSITTKFLDHVLICNYAIN